MMTISADQRIQHRLPKGRPGPWPVFRGLSIRIKLAQLSLPGVQVFP
jgi:hypothetical protein